MPPTEVIEVVEKPLTPSESFAKFRADKAAAATPEGIAKTAADKAAAEAGAAPVVEKRASGDERKFNRKLRLRDEQIGAMRAELDALKKPAATAATSVATDAAPKREDFASDDEFTDAKIAHATAKALAKASAETAQAKEIRDTLDAYNALIAGGPDKYDDWADVLAAGSGAALSVDLGKECPSLMWAIASSPYAADCFYAWLKDSAKLQALIDTYKSGEKGEIAALTAFHRFEGHVGKDAPVAKKPQKADDAVVVTPRVAKPKPSAEAVVRGGAAAPDGKPEVYLPGTNTLNPAYKTWMHNRAAR